MASTPWWRAGSLRWLRLPVTGSPTHRESFVSQHALRRLSGGVTVGAFVWFVLMVSAVESFGLLDDSYIVVLPH
jgi:hypothetical protein